MMTADRAVAGAGTETTGAVASLTTKVVATKVAAKLATKVEARVTTKVAARLTTKVEARVATKEAAEAEAAKAEVAAKAEAEVDYDDPSGKGECPEEVFQLESAMSNNPRRLGMSVVSKRERRGAVAVEFAIVASLLFMLFFATIEFGRALMVLHGLEIAAREGCRTAISRDATEQDVASRVAQRLDAFGISGYTLTIDPSPPRSAEQWAPITVRIAAAYDQVSWLPTSRFLRGITLRGACTLPQEADYDDS